MVDVSARHAEGIDHRHADGEVRCVGSRHNRAAGRRRASRHRLGEHRAIDRRLQIGRRAAAGRRKRVIGQRLQLLDVRQPPVVVTTQRQTFRPGQRTFPRHRRARHLRPHQRGVGVRDRAVEIVHVVVRHVVLRHSHVAGVVAEGTARAHRLRLRFRTHAAAGVHAPHVRRAAAKHIA